MNRFELSNLCLHLTDNNVVFHSWTETVLTNKTNKWNVSLAYKTFLISLHLRKQSLKPENFIHTYAYTKKNSCGERNYSNHYTTVTELFQTKITLTASIDRTCFEIISSLAASPSQQHEQHGMILHQQSEQCTSCLPSLVSLQPEEKDHFSWKIFDASWWI